jgi:ABC-type glutathione transport system ATPase component
MESLVQIRALTVRYTSAFGQAISALENANLLIHAGEAVGALGESGCGKSTLAAALLQLLPAHARYEIERSGFAGKICAHFSAAERVEEPMPIVGLEDRIRRRERVHILMAEVGLSSDWAARLASKFSGGHRNSREPRLLPSNQRHRATRKLAVESAHDERCRFFGEQLLIWLAY